MSKFDPKAANPKGVKLEGKCGFCDTWVPRDQMCSAMVHLHPVPGGRKGTEKIPIRACSGCYSMLEVRIRGARWLRASDERAVK